VDIGSAELYALLSGDTTLVALVDEYSDEPAIFRDCLVMPSDFTGKGINFHLGGTGVDGGLPYTDVLHTLSCRAKLEGESRAIAAAAFAAINRVRAGIVATVMPTLPPQDETDDFNTPVEVRLKKE
jgi:hypothetical protein